MVLDPGSAGLELCKPNKGLIVRGAGMRATTVYVPDGASAPTGQPAFTMRNVVACELSDATFNIAGRFSVGLAVTGQGVLRRVKVMKS
jgi:hypothetical protein